MALANSRCVCRGLREVNLRALWTRTFAMNCSQCAAAFQVLKASLGGGNGPNLRLNDSSSHPAARC
jgi:hypothetical protein